MSAGIWDAKELLSEMLIERQAERAGAKCVSTIRDNIFPHQLTVFFYAF